MGLPWPGVTAEVSADAERDAIALVWCTVRRDREGLKAILAGRGIGDTGPELCLAGELCVLAADLARQLGGEAAVDDYRRRAEGVA